ncbi:MAG: glycosyltransferase family 2 protein [Thermodesulfobacteriota bacterium]
MPRHYEPIENIAVIIVTYNCAELIEKCLDACLLSTERSCDIIVVDNGSSDATKEILRNYHSSVQLIESTNLGFAHGCNLGIKAALHAGNQYQAILFLNPDVLLPAGSIDRMVEVLFAQPEFGGVSPHSVEHPGADRNRLKSLLGACMDVKPLKGRDVVVIDRLQGCCMLWRPEAIQRIGLLDENYFLYWEELDYSLRATKAGFTLLHCYDIVVSHRYGSYERAHRVYYMWRNQFRFASRNYRSPQRFVFLLRRLLSCVKDLSHYVRSGRIDLVRAAFAGLVAALRHKTGKGESVWAKPQPICFGTRK